MQRSSGSVRASLLGLLVLGIAAWPSASRADTSDFVITNFTADYTLDPKVPGGGLEVIEHIEVDFHGHNHGILRALPDGYRGHSTHLRVESVTSETSAPAPFTVSDRGGDDVIQIGSPDTTVAGHQEYTIRYTESDVINFQLDHDELYWNVNGTRWQQPFLSVTAVIHPPKGVPISKTRCLTGGQGSTSANCTETTRGNAATFRTTGSLAANETLTVVLAFPKGTFTEPPPEPTSQLGAVSPPTTFSFWDLLALIFPPLLIGALTHRRWRAHGKDLLPGQIVPRSQPPEGLSVAEAEVILNEHLSDDGISATLVDLAIRGYIRIHAVPEISFELVQGDIRGLRSHEQDLLCGLFKWMQPGETTDVDNLVEREFFRTVQTVQTSIPKSVADAGYFENNPETAGRGMEVTGVVLLSAGVFVAFLGLTLSICLGIGLIAAGLLLLVYGYFMPKRSAEGAQLRDWLEGMKRHMRQEGWTASSAETGTPMARFERLLPYAMIFGLEGELAKAVGDSIHDAPPPWYVGVWQGPYLFTNDLHHTMSHMSTSFRQPSSGSGASGFGGGGFAGGGGGGGGGGGW